MLILGGTGEAAALAAKIDEIPGVDAIASFAGPTQQPITLTTTFYASNELLTNSF